MVDHQKRQELGFSELKKVLQEKETDTTKEVQQLEDILSNYLILTLDWNNVLCLSKRKEGVELTAFLNRVISFAEDYIK